MLWTVTLRVIESSSFISFSLYKTGCFYVFTLQGRSCLAYLFLAGITYLESLLSIKSLINSVVPSSPNTEELIHKW